MNIENDDAIFDEELTEPKDWSVHITGKYGKFNSASGTVDYLSTTAKLGKNINEQQTKLTRYLVPVREILETKNLKFDEIVQRDLDDHRVATKLIPYLLNKERAGPAFFPPIIAVLLPYDGENITTTDFETGIPTEVFPKYKMFWKGEKYGEAYQLAHMSTKNGSDIEVKQSLLSIDDDNAKLVVIDGQHRAMALLAIYRTLYDKWSLVKKGEKYKYFYEERINKIVDELGGKDKAKDLLNELEFPITIIRFPSLTHTNKSPLSVARKIFVDVNYNARIPSESRIRLLSDSELLDIFSREILNKLKEEDHELPLYAVEYDYPGEAKKYTNPGKWSSPINLDFLRAAIEKTVFGPKSIIEDVTENLGKKMSEVDKNTFMQRTLKLDDWFDLKYEEEGEEFTSENIGNKKFPIGKVNELKDSFFNGWGKAIIKVSRELEPYRSHIDSLEELNNDWLSDDTIGSLSKEAVFGGVGVYWTLKSTAKHWEEKESENHSGAKPDVIRAWDSLQGREQEFYQKRAEKYDKSLPLDLVREVYQKANSRACYVGVFLTLATLKHHLNISEDRFSKFIGDTIACLNSSINYKDKNLANRKSIFSKNVENPLIIIPKLDTHIAQYFRYIWLEILFNSPTIPDYLDKYDSNKKISGLVDDARKSYFYYIHNSEVKLFKSQYGKSKKPDEINTLGFDSAVTKLGAALKTWFGYSDSNYNKWLEDKLKQRYNNDLAEYFSKVDDINDD
jgi:hypothetical protein